MVTVRVIFEETAVGMSGRGREGWRARVVRSMLGVVYIKSTIKAARMRF